MTLLLRSPLLSSVDLWFSTCSKLHCNNRCLWCNWHLFFFYSFQFPKKYSMTYLSSSLVPIGTNLKPMIIQITCMTPKSHLPTTILPLSPNFVSFSLLLFHSCSLFPSFTSLLTSFFLWQLGKIHSSCSLCSPRFC